MKLFVRCVLTSAFLYHLHPDPFPHISR